MEDMPGNRVGGTLVRRWVFTKKAVSYRHCSAPAAGGRRRENNITPWRSSVYCDADWSTQPCGAFWHEHLTVYLIETDETVLYRFLAWGVQPSGGVQRTASNPQLGISDSVRFQTNFHFTASTPQPMQTRHATDDDVLKI